MKENRITKMLVGMLIGIAGLIAGGLLFAVIYKIATHVSFQFMNANFDLIFGSSPIQTATGALIVNFVLFYIFMTKKKNMYAQGVMLVSILTIILALIF